MLTTSAFLLGQEQKSCNEFSNDIECKRLISLCVESEIAKTETTDLLDIRENDYIRYMAEYMGIDPQAEDVKEQIRAWITDPTNQGKPMCPADNEYEEVVEEWFVTRALHVANGDAINLLFHPAYLGLSVEIKDSNGNDVLAIVEGILANEEDLDDDLRVYIETIRNCVKAVKDKKDPGIWRYKICELNF